MSEQEPVIGIDLGTTNSVVATVHNRTPQVIKNKSGMPLTPSVVANSRSGKILVGLMAKRQALTNPSQTIYASKRLIGRQFSAEQTQAALKILPYKVEAGEHDDIRVHLGDKAVTLPEISSHILRALRNDAEEFLGKQTRKAVITVPAYFSDSQRQATKDAGSIAGLDVLRIINEPTAAALAYGFGKNVHGKVVVYDLGGGTFDVSVLEIADGVFDVRASGGDTFLGGEDFDNRIIEWLVTEFGTSHDTDLRKDPMALQRLKDAAELAKIELSTVSETQINLPFIGTSPTGGAALHLQKSFDRKRLESLCADLVERTITIVAKVVNEAKINVADLTEVILVGGMTRMPLVQDAVKNFFKRQPSKAVHPEEVVALGAAIQADILTASTSDVVLLDVTPQSLGVAIVGGYVRTLIPKNSTIPTSVTEVFSTSRDNQTTVKVVVLQGENPVAHKNELLGEFILAGLRKAPRGTVNIDVTFDINSEGIVAVSAKDRETGKVQSIQVTASGGLTREELKRILEEQADMLLEARAEEETKKKQSELKELIAEAMTVTAQLDRPGLDERVRTGPLAAMRTHIDSAREAIERSQLAVLMQECEKLSRSTTVLKTFLHREPK